MPLLLIRSGDTCSVGNLACGKDCHGPQLSVWCLWSDHVADEEEKMMSGNAAQSRLAAALDGAVQLVRDADLRPAAAAVAGYAAQEACSSPE